MLALVGGAPRVWAALVPSKDHKAAYLEVLAWLVRGGWVERLRTGAWVRVPGWVVARAEAEAAEAEGGVADSLEAEGSDVGSDTSSTHTAVSPSPSRPQAPAPQLVLHPLRPSATTSHHLALISAHLLHTQGPESRDAWERCVKYFDGVHALEKMAVREGWKRGRVESWVEGWRAEGVLVGGRWV